MTDTLSTSFAGNEAARPTRHPSLLSMATFACGRDPYFPAWPDVLQLNAFQPGLRQHVIDTVSRIAGQCDGIRCDMAMLLLKRCSSAHGEAARVSRRQPSTGWM